MSGELIDSYWREITSIIEGGLRPDPYRVSSYAEHMAARLEDAGETRMAARIRRLVSESSKPAGSTFLTQAFPTDVEAQQSLVEEVLPLGSPKYPVLPSSTARELQRFVELNRRSGELASEGISTPTTLLLFGPPGCGKTMASVAIACDLGLPLFVVRLDSLLGSFLGNSAKNLRRVFDHAFSRPCVLLLDEFDAIGKMRDDAHEVGEVKRLVGTLLQNLDRIQGEQILIAATNHHHMLDPAIWRRFDVTLLIGKLDETEIFSLVSELVPKGELSPLNLKAVARLAHGLSGSDITKVLHRAAQDKFLCPKQSFLVRIASGVLARVKGYEESDHHTDSKREMILSVHRQSGESLTVRQVARLVGCSATYAHEVINNMEK